MAGSSGHGDESLSSINEGNISNSCGASSFSIMTLLHGVSLLVSYPYI